MIQDTFDMQSSIVDELKNDSSFLLALKVQDKEDKELLSKKINLQRLNMELFETKSPPLVSIYFSDASESNNYLLNYAVLKIETYTFNRLQAKPLVKAIKNIMREKFKLRIVAEGEDFCDIKNVYKYVIEYLPMTWS